MYEEWRNAGTAREEKEKVRRRGNLWMLVGMTDTDAVDRIRWKQITCRGDPLEGKTERMLKMFSLKQC